MKKPTYTLSIPQPCHERWDAMTPSEKGRFCASCQTQVVDFTGLSDREAIQLIEQSSGKVCGRLHPQQIDRPMVFEPWAQRASVRFSGFFAGLMLLSSAESSATPTEPVEIVQASLVSNDSASRIDVHASHQQDSVEYKIFGTVIDKHIKEGVPFAQVSVTETDTHVITDFEGRFELTFSREQLGSNLNLKVKFVGFEDVNSSVKSKELLKKKKLEFVFKMESFLIIGEVIIIKE